MIKIFVSYSHQDKQLIARDSLLGFLRGLERDEEVEFWVDEQIPGGSKWDDEIRGQIASCDIALVLVSQAYLDSKYCTDVEIRAFLDRCQAGGMDLFPVLVSPCEWDRHPWLAERQLLPGSGKALEEWDQEPGSRKRTYLKIRRELRAAIERARQRIASQQTSEDVSTVTSRRQISLVHCRLSAQDRNAAPLPHEDLVEVLFEAAPHFQKAYTSIVHRFEGHVAEEGSSKLIL